MIPEFTHFQQFEVIVIIWLAFSAVADSAITTALVWHLVCNNPSLLTVTHYIRLYINVEEAQDWVLSD